MSNPIKRLPRVLAGFSVLWLHNVRGGSHQKAKSAGGLKVLNQM